MDKDSQEIINVILQGISDMGKKLEQKFDERCDRLEDRFDKLEARVESLEENVKDIQADMMIITGKVDKQGREIDRLKRAM